jgi:hypothetical protein
VCLCVHLPIVGVFVCDTVLCVPLLRSSSDRRCDDVLILLLVPFSLRCCVQGLCPFTTGFECSFLEARRLGVFDGACSSRLSSSSVGQISICPSRLAQSDASLLGRIAYSSFTISPVAPSQASVRLVVWSSVPRPRSISLSSVTFRLPSQTVAGLVVCRSLSQLVVLLLLLLLHRVL